jgi:serine/threonine protein kinase
VPITEQADDDARRLAEEVLGRLADGEAIDLPALAARLPDDAARQRFLRLVEEGRRVQGLLPRTLRPGMTLGGRYRLEREIGAGGMGRVFEATDRQLERRVAVKVLTAVASETFDHEQQFLNEAVLLAGLQHPNIVAVHELGKAPTEQPYLVMDLVEGTAVSEVLERVRAALQGRGGGPPREGRLLLEAIGRALPAGRRPPPAGEDWFRAVARVALEAARTLEAAHSQGIVHRDVKPANVLLRGDATPVVLDFGLAGSLDRARGALSRGLFGTVAYLAPEQVDSGRIGADPRTDVYQLGLLLYELLTLRRAFPGDEISALLARIGRGEFLRPRAADRGVPPELEAVCLKAMELDPARRYASMRELREDLQRWVEDSRLPLAARGGALASGLRSTRYAVRRNRLAASVLATAATAVLAWFVLKPPPPPWVGDLRPFRLPAGASKPVTDYFRDVEPGDVLGVRLQKQEGAEPLHVYALSIFGPEGRRELVAPMTLDVAGREDEDTTRWGQRVSPGESVSCTRVEEQAADGQAEHLLVFAAAGPQPRLERWMDELYRLGRLSDAGAVPYERARETFERLQAGSIERGGQAQLDDAEKAVLDAAFSADEALGEDDWSLADPRREEWPFRVKVPD